VADRRDLGVLTVPIGAACYRPGESVESLLQQADQALYDVKNGGRKRVASAV
jgi:PleD family two-component response regulator